MSMTINVIPGTGVWKIICSKNGLLSNVMNDYKYTRGGMPGYAKSHYIAMFVSDIFVFSPMTCV